jgi:hypothetical protein
MAVFDPKVTSEISDRGVQKRLSVARNRIKPQTLAVIEALKKNFIHIFNVGPWKHVVNTGSTGQFLIPACPWNKPYVELLVTDGKGGMVPPITAIMEELVIKNEDEYSKLEDDGIGFAHAMLGEGRGARPDQALTHFGVFVAEGEKPTKEELAAAREKLKAKCSSLYGYITNIYATDRKLFSQVVNPDVHFVAAKVLGRDNPQDSPWMLDAAPTGRVKCKMCGRVVDPDVAMCEGGHIVNQDLYLAAMAEQENVLAAVKK